MMSISDCRCGVEYKPPNSGGLDYIQGGAEINIVSQSSCQAIIIPETFRKTNIPGW